MSPTAVDSVREKALADYRKKLTEHKEIEDKLKQCKLLFLNCSLIHLLPVNYYFPICLSIWQWRYFS